MVEGVDLDFIDNPYAWFNMCEGLANIRERLDKVIVSLEWQLRFPWAAVIHQVACKFNHNHIQFSLNFERV